MSARQWIGLTGCCALLLPWCVRGQPRYPSGLRVESDLVLVPVTVSDLFNHPIKGLTKDSFRVFDNGVEQNISQFSMEDAPMTIGLVFDKSGSMRYRLDRARLAAAAFFLTANPEDEFFLVDFASEPRLAVPLTRNVERIEDRITQARPAGTTALLDAVYLALNHIRKSHYGRKALLIVSDGGDNASRYTRNEVNRVLRESDVLIYSIGVFGSYNRWRPVEEVDGPELLRKISESSGGRLIPITDTIQLPYMAVKVGMEMRNRYVLGYAPAGIQDNGRYHRVQVKLTPPDGLPPLHASWRTGYYAPSQ